jgi:hypothetical protein
MFEERRTALILDQKSVEECLSNLKKANGPDRLEKFFELAGNAWLSHEKAFHEEKREMLKIFTSNRQLDRQNLYLKPSIPFQEIADRFKNTHCDQQQDIPQTKLNLAGQLPDLSRGLEWNRRH